MAEDNNPQMNSLIETLRLQNEAQKASADEAKYQRELSLALSLGLSLIIIAVIINILTYTIKNKFL